MTTTTAQRTLTIDDIQSAMRARGSHWWDPSSMRFFGTRVHSQVYSGPGGIYFVTSEKPPYGSRACTVRQYLPESAEVETIGDCADSTKHCAHRDARELAAEPIEEQIDAAMCRLDRHMTGNDKSGNVTKYGTPEELYDGGSRGIIYLSDGGYTRAIVRHYEDGSGLYLELVDVPESAAEETRERFSAVYKLQRKVCRLLQTWHELQAGEIEGGDAPHHEVSELEQFIADMTAHGCKGVTETRAVDLMKQAKRHHRYCEAQCGDGSHNQEAKARYADVMRPKVEGKIVAMVEAIGAAGVQFSGDPRGCTVKLTFHDGATNDFGREGWCVPQGE